MSSWGFVIIRHVCNEITDRYWKKCYSQIRAFYPDIPVMIVDDSSDKKFLCEDLPTTNCTTIYDTEHRGSAEWLPYYHFYRLRPFETAVVIHDSVFVQSPIDFANMLNANEPIRFLWNFRHAFDGDLTSLARELCEPLVPYGDTLMRLYPRGDLWHGCFGVMSVVRWEFLDLIDKSCGIFDKWLRVIHARTHRHALERVFGLVATIFYSSPIRIVFGDIHQYVRWGVTFTEYEANPYAFAHLPVMKVWSAR